MRNESDEGSRVDVEVTAVPAPSPSVLDPFTSGRLDLRNRLAFVATVTNLGRNAEITDDLVAYYAARARGGAGLIVTEGLSVHPTSLPNGTVPLAFSEALVPGFHRLAEACHEHGAAVFGQLWHVGRQALWNPTLQPWAPSGGRDPYSGVTARAMTDAQVREVVDGFVRSAVNLRDAGFDGVELHGAHGYLITQFLSPWSNHREDAWGGDTTRRTAFVIAIVRGIRQACGPDFPVGLKLSAHEYVEGGIDLDEAKRIVRVLDDEAPTDFLAVSQANFSPSLEYHVPDLAFEDTPFAHLAVGVREVSDGVPVMALAKVPDIATANKLVADGVADLVGMARAWVADADLVRKVEAGQTPRPCTYCNTCWDFIHTGRRIACMYAPDTGREASHPSVPEQVPERHRLTVRVVGAGPAGLEAARTAARRGHVVHLYDREDRAGGRLLRDARTPGRERMALAVEWLEDAVTAAGARIHLGTEVTNDDVAAWPTTDRIVLATGAVPVLTDIPGTVPLPLPEATGELVGPIVVVDELEEEPVYAFATDRAQHGADVVVLTRREVLARRVAYVSRIGVFRRLDEAGVAVHTLVEPVRVQAGRLIVRHVYSGRERDLGPVGTVVLAGPSAPAPALTGGRETVVVGDASSPRGYVAVTQEAHDVAAHLEDE
ncbi:MAG: FAD-dependent oxidoreductase [Pseudonocardia sp.]|nr:FAD-dependent oxidoreductase [Pseudonocardia sp.]MBO0872191.1 FAD-dependent oxidoreductase [Pseudonocardia sp.]